MHSHLDLIAKPSFLNNYIVKLQQYKWNSEGKLKSNLAGKSLLVGSFNGYGHISRLPSAFEERRRSPAQLFLEHQIAMFNRGHLR